MQAQRKRRVMASISKEKACRTVTVIVVVCGRCEGVGWVRGCHRRKMQAQRNRRVMASISKEKACRTITVIGEVWGRCEGIRGG